MRPDQKLDKAIAEIVDDIMQEQYLQAEDFRADVRDVSKTCYVSYGKVISLIEAGLKEATENE